MTSKENLFGNILKTLSWGLLAGLLWGLYEASVLLLTQYRALIGQDASGIWNLYSAALLNYGFFGLVLGGASCAYLTATWLTFKKTREDFAAGRYFVLSIAVLVMVLWAGVYANRYPLARIPLSHPFSIGASLAIIVAGFALLQILYRTVGGRSSSPQTGLLNLKTVGKMLAPPVVVLLGGLILHSFSSQETATAETDLTTSAGSTVVSHPDAGNLDAPPNIILITAETLRADHLPLYGYDKPLKTPNIEKLAQQGVTFENYFTNSSWTRASVTSIMTSLFPQQHGATGLHVTLMDSVLTLPKILEAHGYHSAAFLTNVNSVSKGFAFSEVYYDEMIEAFRNPLAVSPFSLKPFLVRRLLGTENQLSQDFPFVFPTEFVNDWYLDAANVNSFIQKWLVTAPEKPLFLQIHYLDPHEPYLRHPYEAVQFNLKSGWTVDSIVELYDQEIEYLDSELGRLQKILAAAGRLQNSLFIFTSDHGEEFLDHGGWGHGNHLYDETLRVPLVMRFPDGKWAGSRVASPTSSVDLAPTIVEAAGVDAPPDFEGHSLTPVITGAEQGHRLITSHLLAPSFEMASIMKDDMKFISRTGLNSGKYLFNLAQDPGEQKNLIEQHPEIAAELEATLAIVDQKFKAEQRQGKQLSLTEEQKKRLRALGYLK